MPILFKKSRRKEKNERQIREGGGGLCLCSVRQGTQRPAKQNDTAAWAWEEEGWVRQTWNLRLPQSVSVKCQFSDVSIFSQMTSYMCIHLSLFLLCHNPFSDLKNIFWKLTRCFLAKQTPNVIQPLSQELLEINAATGMLLPSCYYM